MPLPQSVARFNKRVTNPILSPIVRFLPGFGMIIHRGRTSGRVYRTPMMAFRSADGRQLHFALTYGKDADWVRNVVAAGVATFDSRWSGELRLTDPRVLHAPKHRVVPRFIRVVLRLMRVDDFLEMTIAD
jgi:deazaflavin-dependent oxidoreductase (nitroreductase family)